MTTGLLPFAFGSYGEFEPDMVPLLNVGISSSSLLPTEYTGSSNSFSAGTPLRTVFFLMLIIL